MSGENKEGGPKIGDTIPQEVLEGMREQAKENLKGQLETKISDDLEALALAEKDPAFKNSPEIQQIKSELGAFLEKVKALEDPPEAEVISFETEREALSNRLSETIQKIESQEPAPVTPPTTETELPAAPQPKERKSYMVQGRRDEELAGRIETESKEKQKEYQEEQLPLVAERLDDQKTKLKEILTKPDLGPEKTAQIQEALRETDQFEMSAKVLKERGELISNDVIERFWQRVENNFDIISEQFLVPANLPIESSPEGDRLTQELEQRLKEAQEPAEKMDIDLGEKEPLTQELPTESEPLKSALDIAMEKTEEVSKAVKEVKSENEEANKSFLEGDIPKEMRRDIADIRKAKLEEAEKNKGVVDAEFTEIKPEEAELIAKVETIEDVEKLPEATKEKIAKGFATWGLRADAWKNEQWSKLFGNVSKIYAEGTGGDRFFKNLKADFIRDRDKAREKAKKIDDGVITRTASIMSLTGNILRYGRGLMDATGMSVVNPLKWVTWGAMATSRTLEAAKEVSLETTTKDRLLDVDMALEEAIKIYEKAGGTYSVDKGGDEKASKENLKTTYYRDIPKDLVERLNSRSTDEKRTMLQEFSLKLITLGIERSVKNTAKEIELIEASSIPQGEKDKKIQEFVLKHEAKLRDYDRIIDSNGQMDTLAIVSKRIAQLGRVTATAMTLETLAEMPFAVEKMWDNAAEALGNSGPPIKEVLTPEQIEKNNAFFDSVAGVNSKDGLSTEEALQIAKTSEDWKACGLEREADELNTHFAQFLESSPNTLTETPALEDIKPGSASVAETLKPFRFENPIAGNQDSIWFSTEQSFRMNPDRFGYDASKDGTISDWAKKRTAETLKELADKKFGGKLPDLVHDGDKVIVEIGADGKPYVNFENSSGIPAGHLPEKPSLSVPEAGKADAQAVGVEKFEKAWRETPADSRNSIVRQFILGEMSKPEYQAGDFPRPNPERIDTYTKMFKGEWDKISTPEKLAQSLFEFDNRVKEYTALILEGKFDKNVDPVSFQQLKENIFPVEGKSGKLYFTQFVDEGKWQLFEEDKQGATHQLDRKKGFLGGKTKVFDTMHVRKFLRGH
ncbi:MAG: hypothetical protein Q8Q95_04160 [bacterium]|nr:hypothetical protein [bacterium]